MPITDILSSTYISQLFRYYKTFTLYSTPIQPQPQDASFVHFLFLGVVPLGWLQRQVSYSAEAHTRTIHIRNAGVHSNSWLTGCPTYPLTVATHGAQTRQKVWLAALHVSNVCMLTMDVYVPLQNACPQALMSDFDTIKHSCTVQNGKASRSQWTYKEC